MWFVVVAVAVVVAVLVGVWGKRSPNSVYINSRSTALAAVMLQQHDQGSVVVK